MSTLPSPLSPSAASVQLGLAERDLDFARAATGQPMRALLDACAARVLPLAADVQPSRQAVLLRDLAIEFYAAGGRFQAAIAPMAKSVLLFSDLQDLVSLRRCRSVQCLLLADCGSFSDAIEAGTHALRLASALDDPLGEAAALVNLAIAFQFSGLVQESQSCAERALGIAQRFELPAVLPIAYHNLSLCASRQQDLRRALEFNALAAETSHFNPHFPEVFRALVESFACRFNIHLSNLPAARRHIELAHDFSARSASERARVCVDSAQGLLHVCLGQPDHGLPLLRAAVDAARLQQFDNLSIAMMSLVHAHEFLGDSSSALVVLRELIAWTRRAATDAAIVRAQYAHLFEQSAPRAMVDDVDVPDRLQKLSERFRALPAHAAATATAPQCP